MITVDLRYADGTLKARYTAQPLSLTVAAGCAVRAVWQRPAVGSGDMLFATGDVLHEFFYSDRYYNVFALYDGAGPRLKGWYCNICRPARITPDTVYCEDLALDLWVAADGTQHVLDRDEYAALGLAADEAAACDAALAALQRLAALGQLPC